MTHSLPGERAAGAGFQQLAPARLRETNMRKMMTVILVILGLFTACAGNAPQAKADALNDHTVILDESGKIIPWTEEPGQAYGHVMDIAWDYMLNRVPSDSTNGKPTYYSYSYLLPDSQQPYPWPHNPAGSYGMLIESAVKYYGYSGNLGPMRLAQNVATAMLDNGMTPSGWVWPNVPYSSGDAGSLVYQGASYGDVTGQGDGRGVIEPDKVGEMGYGWLQLYRFDGNTRYRDAAIMAANALARNIRPGSAVQSPWPYRVYAETGVVREDYTANVIGPIRLFDGLISLGLGDTAAYRSARNSAWNWMMNFPMQNNTWSNYFEDGPIWPDLSNFDQYSAMMTARYILEHPEYDADWEHHVRDLIAWVETVFAEPAYGANSIAEQIIFHHPMGSHTSRYASVNALLYAATGDLSAREKAYRALNWATYMARPDGVVIDGPEVNHQWFTDGYGDYIRHFMTSLGAIPEWAPKGQNHLLKTTSLIRSITYDAAGVRYSTADSASIEVLKLDFAPRTVTVDNVVLLQRQQLDQPGWTFDSATMVLRVRHDSGTHIGISKPQAIPPDNPPTGATLWPATAIPSTVDAGADSPVELGVKFRSDTSGSISGIRFYKSVANSGPHTARLWSGSGALLATASFGNETASGWQQANFPTPVAVSANMIYIASYHCGGGHYSYNLNYFSGTGRDAPPLHAPADGISGINGVFSYGPAGSFPFKGWYGANYWVDVVFNSASSADTAPPTVTSFIVPASSQTLTVPISTLNASDNIAVTGYLVTETATVPPASATGWSINVPTSYTFGSAGAKTLYAWAKDAAGNVSAGKIATMTITASVSVGSTLWSATAVPEKADSGTDDPVELGVKFITQTSGYITGIRFYKSADNLGIHTGSLWSDSGELLATATFNNETPSGWQEVQFSKPVLIVPLRVYLASYHTETGHYSCDKNYFAGKGYYNPPLYALTDTSYSSNGVYAYGSSSFPNKGWRSSNYWVDVVFQPLASP